MEKTKFQELVGAKRIVDVVICSPGQAHWCGWWCREARATDVEDGESVEAAAKKNRAREDAWHRMME